MAIINRPNLRGEGEPVARLRTLKRERNRYRADPDAASQLLNVGESSRDRNIPADEHAAWMQVASTILNLSEVVTRN